MHCPLVIIIDVIMHAFPYSASAQALNYGQARLFHSHAQVIVSYWFDEENKSIYVED